MEKEAREAKYSTHEAKTALAAWKKTNPRAYEPRTGFEGEEDGEKEPKTQLTRSSKRKRTMGNV